ncbi:hydrogen peroxide-inducible genes activator [Octadecabacter sp.]|nr:hydrogen peroxide-inducible genes activator [Octadecabacter sp.]MDC1379899.1 hydrogen peroxide-inducible genes activator [Octadecabacter sp.]
MTNLTLKQFRYFEALAQHGHFGHAADASGISQPALSMQIKEMEADLGVALFERGPRHVRLTRFGEEFAPRVRDILRSVDEVSDLARLSQNTLSGRLRIGVIPTIAPYLLPSFIGQLTHDHPTLDLQIRETLTSRLIEELAQGRIDAAIVALPVSEPSFEEVEIFEENFVLIRPDIDADRAVPDAADLAKMQLLLLEEGHCFRDQALAFCSMRSPLQREGLDGSSLSTLVQLVGAGIGVTLIPDMAVSVETRSANVSVARFKGVQPKRTIGMIWRKTSPLADQFRLIADIVARAAKVGR